MQETLHRDPPSGPHPAVADFLTLVGSALWLDLYAALRGACPFDLSSSQHLILIAAHSALVAAFLPGYFTQIVEHPRLFLLGTFVVVGGVTVLDFLPTTLFLGFVVVTLSTSLAWRAVKDTVFGDSADPLRRLRQAENKNPEVKMDEFFRARRIVLEALDRRPRLPRTELVEAAQRQGVSELAMMEAVAKYPWVLHDPRDDCFWMKESPAQEEETDPYSWIRG